MTLTTKPRSSCCDAPAKVNVMDPGKMFCKKCGADCTVAKAMPKFSTLSTVRKVSGEGEVFREKVWPRCKGKSEVSGADLLPFGDPMWHWQFSHLLPKGSYKEDQVDPNNIIAVTVHEHTVEWPIVKEKDDDWLKANGYTHWIPKVTVFRALRLKYNQRLRAELSGKI